VGVPKSLLGVQVWVMTLGEAMLFMPGSVVTAPDGETWKVVSFDGPHELGFRVHLERDATLRLPSSARAVARSSPSEVHGEPAAEQDTGRHGVGEGDRRSPAENPRC
jgi:hypothetical protein